jgi:CBS domain-containing protein
MRIRDLAVREPVTMRPDGTLHEAARLMASHGVGCVIVTDVGTDGGTGDERVVGVVTDRDLVVRGLAARVPDDGRVDGVMSTDVVAVDADDDVRDVVKTFGHHAVRRLPVVTGQRVTGVVTIDDLLVAVHDELADLTKGVTAQLLFPHGHDEPARPAVLT